LNELILLMARQDYHERNQQLPFKMNLSKAVRFWSVNFDDGGLPNGESALQLILRTAVIQCLEIGVAISPCT